MRLVSEASFLNKCQALNMRCMRGCFLLKHTVEVLWEYRGRYCRAYCEGYCRAYCGRYVNAVPSRSVDSAGRSVHCADDGYIDDQVDRCR